jgi:hypothetical protein
MVYCIRLQLKRQHNTWAQRAQNVIASYVVGGVAAELGGGKFANGGMSAAFSRMFNDLGYPNYILTISIYKTIL